ncbi:phage protein Gp27 family protein [Plastoroseomonas hellenica]|uniref:phage protein Gp27 family protein n=1 Tax=Plastoroseomonas hellenica TaxID=2687306 RepID=UPI001BAE469E|nr:phage protein Gp27 family protein [Plastoroseomonas hellenica]MBR0644001.1 DUF3486 family protein [Plastoroseomonas hellenica]
MARPSSIDRLPQEIREEIGRLRDHGKTLDEILAHLRQLSVEVSRSALGRHVRGMEVVGERLRRSRSVSEALVRQLGDAPESTTARLNIEMLHSFLFDVLSSTEEGEEGAAVAEMLKNPKALALFAEATERLTKASRHNVEFIAAAEKRAEERAKKAAAGAVQAEAKQRGLNADTVAAIKARIFGVDARAA